MDNLLVFPHTADMGVVAGISSDLLPRLRDDLIHRRIESGLSVLEERRGQIKALDPVEKGAARLLGYLAQWVDIGFASPALIQEILWRFPKRARPGLALIDYLHLRMAEGLVSMYSDDFADAIRHFEFVSSLDEDVADAELLAISNFWIARCLRQEGRYDDAHTYAARASQLARGAGFHCVAAVIQVLESWLVFQKGKVKEASAILGEAEAALESGDDYVTRGNIQSAYGRIARREGRYERALERFDRAIGEYKRRDPRHRNLARSLVNAAVVKRLIAVQLQKSVDRRAAPHAEAPSAGSRAGIRAQIEKIRGEAFRDLAEAFSIYEEAQSRRGLAAVHMNRGFLHLDHGELEDAGCEAATAFEIAAEKSDYIEMARARILQCMVENAKFEEQIEAPSGPGQHARLADEYARDSIEFARHTQNDRLLARAYIWRGITLAADFFGDADGAQQCCDSATALFKAGGQEEVWDDLQALRAKILHHGRVDTALQEWSQGLVGGKTFQQLTEQFAAVVIPKVWEREGRKVARVAARLSVSPKKVRRVLQAAGLLSRAEPE